MSTAAAAIELQEKTRAERGKLGFWIYLMTDLMLFAALFATYIVLRQNIADGPSGREFFDMQFVLVETVLLLTSSYLCGLAMLTLRAGNKRTTLGLLLATGLLGAAFLGMEIYEFAHLVHEGYDWTRSAFLSAFFTLVGTHGAHILVGLIWLSVVWIRLMKRGITHQTKHHLGLFSLFWHFLDVVWIFVFTVVYLMGVA